LLGAQPHLIVVVIDQSSGARTGASVIRVRVSIQSKYKAPSARSAAACKLIVGNPSGRGARADGVST
jgi:hypothetical protein